MGSQHKSSKSKSSRVTSLLSRKSKAP
jgi:type III secretion system FlhB-like substrate exporter